MAKRGNQTVDMNDAAVRVILATLLTDFTTRGLGAEYLRKGYEGPSPAALRQQCCSAGEFSEVDYDLAYKSLVLANLVKTGPMVPYDNPPGSMVVFLGLRSANKYVRLTETGYREASRIGTIRPRIAAAASQHVHISGGNFHNSPIGVGHGVQQTLNVNTATTDELIEKLREEVRKIVDDGSRQQEIIEKLNALQSAHDKPTRIERYMQVMGALGDHITVLSFLLTPLLHSL